MTDPRTSKLAELLVKYSVGVMPGYRIIIQGGNAALPLLRACYAEVLKAGGYPFVVPAFDYDDIFYEYASDSQLQYVHEPQRYMINNYDGRIVVLSDENTKSKSRVDPQKMVTFDRGHSELMKISMQRSAAKKYHWVVAPYPTQAYAQDAEMSLREYEDFVYRACMPDVYDPIGYWQKFSLRQQKVVDWLAGKKRIRVLGKETDLTLSVEGRKFINCDGKFNMPDGEVFTGPVEDSAQGQVCFSYPAINDGREVTSIRLWFEKGKVVKATAEKNEKYLNETLDTDAGSRFLGEFAIGTNEGIQEFTREILFDEKIGGSFHLAVGAGYPETGSKNESGVHWDMVCDLREGGEIWADEQLMYKNGKFIIPF